MTDDSCKPSRSAGSVPRACTPFSPPPPTSSVPVVAPPVFVPVAPVMPVMTVSGAAPDRFGNVDIRPFVRTVLDQALLDLDLFAPFLARIVESGTFAPASGISRGALDPAVRASLDLADSAVQDVSGKADKAVPSASGNLASLDASGNLVDSLKSPSDFAPASHASDGSIHLSATEIGQIAAGEVAKVVANAPGTMDTLKEIADILGSAQQSGTVLKRISDLESGKVDQVPGKGLSANDYTDADKAKLDGMSPQAQADWGQTDVTAPDFIKNKPTIPVPVTIDAALSQTSENPVQNKAVALALAGKRDVSDLWIRGVPSLQTPGWFACNGVLSERGTGPWQINLQDTYLTVSEDSEFQYTVSDQGGNSVAIDISSSDAEFDATAVLGGVSYRVVGIVDEIAGSSDVAEKQDALSSAQMDAVNSGATAAKVATWDGYAAQIAAKANAAAVNAALQGKANTTDLPYALVTPGEWEFSGSGVQGGEYMDEWIDSGTEEWWYQIKRGESGISDTLSFDSRQSIVSFPDVGIVATLLPKGHLLDRAVNAVPVSSATEITLPEKIDGKSRDFYVRLAVSAESVVTFAATDSGGDAVAWDSMGSPSGTLAAGTYLYRFTEVADGVFHAADITNGGSIDPAVLDEKLDASSAAPAFSESLTYLAGEYVIYGGVLYRCKTAVTTAGAWTGTSNWEADDMTSPDATLDIMSDGRLRVVTVAGEDLWMQGYDLESTSAQVLKCEKVNLLSFPATSASAFDSTATYAVGDSVVYGGMVYKFTAAHSAGAWVGTDAAVDSVSLTMPYVPVGKVGDFVLDVDNSANASVKMVAELSGLFTAFDVFVDKGRNLSDLLTFDGGERCELYFTMTAFGTQAKPAWKVVKQVVEKQEAGS